jgi:hypothetical protein
MISQRVLFGKDPALQDVAVVSVVGNTATVQLEPGYTYYWTVETEAAGGWYRGSVWSFSTPLCLFGIEEGDLTDDCRIDYMDFAVMASHWLRADEFVVGQQIPNVAEDAIVFYYSFDETSGRTAHDTAGIGYPVYDGNLAVSDDFSFDKYSVPGKFGTALDFGGTLNQQIQIGATGLDRDSLPSPEKGFTVSFWAKGDDWTASQVMFAYFGLGLRLTIGLEIQQLDGHATTVPALRVYTRDSRNGSTVLNRRGRYLSPEWLADEAAGQWHHIAVVVEPAEEGFSGGPPIIYLDGVPGDTNTTNAWANNEVFPILFGNRNGTSRPYRGALDDFVIFNKVLTEQEVVGIYTSDKPVIYYTPTNPNPANREYTVTPGEVELSWTPADGMSSQKVLFGTDPEALSLLSSTPVQLDPARTYYWSVQPNNTYAGPIWPFGTSPCAFGPVGSLSGDCRVDVADLAVIASNWLRIAEYEN